MRRLNSELTNGWRVSVLLLGSRKERNVLNKMGYHKQSDRQIWNPSLGRKHKISDSGFMKQQKISPHRVGFYTYVDSEQEWWSFWGNEWWSKCQACIRKNQILRFLANTHSLEISVLPFLLLSIDSGNYNQPRIPQTQVFDLLESLHFSFGAFHSLHVL